MADRGDFTGNIAAHLPRMARLQPSEAAVICASGRDADGSTRYRQISFAELDADSDCMAHGLSRLGIGPGVRAVLMVPPGPDFFALTFALFKAGVVPVMVDPGMGTGKMGRCLSRARPAAFIGTGKAQLARLLLGWSRATLRVPVLAAPTRWWPGPTLHDLRHPADRGRAFAVHDAADDETAAILFTSGSTGTPKGVVYTHGMFQQQVRQIRDAFHIEPGERDLSTFPLFALFGPAMGMTAVVPDMDPARPADAEPARLLEAAQRFAVTSLFGSPALLDRLGRYADGREVRLPGLRRILCAGAPVAADTLARCRPLLPEGARVHTPYGATECLPVSSLDSETILSETRHRTDAGGGICVGHALPGVEVKVIRIDDGVIPEWSDELELPQGEIGEFAVRAAHAKREYFGDAAATALAGISDPARGGSWHRMGDVGYVDDSGRLWFCGRKSHRVVLPERTLFTIPCEAVFNTHPAVFRSALVGVAGGSGTVPVICIQLEADAGGIDRDSLRAELLQRARQHAHTRSITNLLFHPAFPVDVRHNAKIFREQLARWAARRLPPGT